MQIVEFGDRGVPGFEHFDVQIAGDGFQLFWRYFIYQPVHQIPPVQKLSDGFPATSVNPAIARWKAWECRFGIPGTTTL